MASIDMCEHDWPGTGCKECKREKEANETWQAREIERLRLNIAEYNEHERCYQSELAAQLPSQGGEAVEVVAEIYWTNENPEWQLDMLCEIPCAPLERIKLYTHPSYQVAEGVVVSRELRSVLAMILNALDRDAVEGKAVRGEMAVELRALLASAEGVKDENI